MSNEGPFREMKALKSNHKAGRDRKTDGEDAQTRAEECAGLQGPARQDRLIALISENSSPSKRTDDGPPVAGPR